MSTLKYRVVINKQLSCFIPRDTSLEEAKRVYDFYKKYYGDRVWYTFIELFDNEGKTIESSIGEL